ncbi:hypothetical protein X975_26858, partial [Stegodyphus mimosarum]
MKPVKLVSLASSRYATAQPTVTPTVVLKHAIEPGVRRSARC